MKNLVQLTIMAGILASSVFFSQCKKETESGAQEQEISLAVSTPGNLLKSAPIYQLNKAKHIVLTIKKNDNSPTIYTSSKIDIYQSNGEFYSQKLALKVGLYKITEFFLTDSVDNPIFAVPTKGSPGEQDVNLPLPISFNVSANHSSQVNIEVVSTANKPLEYFGFVRFSISERKGVTFMIAATDLLSGNLLTADLTIYNNKNKKDKKSFKIGAHANNTFIIDTSKFNCPEPLLIISKYGYEPISKVFEWSELSRYLKTPLVIELGRSGYTSCGTIEDYDGNSYLTVRIGDQCWMAENLRTTHYADGTPIYQATREDLTSWVDPSAIANGMYRGQFYTWSAATNDAAGSVSNPSRVQGACPAGWHIPSHAEWIQMRDYLIANGYGYHGVATDIAKSLASTSEWDINFVYDIALLQELTNNASGFAGRPLSFRILDNYEGSGTEADWWSATESSTSPSSMARIWRIGYNTLELRAVDGFKKFLVNVRCVKD